MMSTLAARAAVPGGKLLNPLQPPARATSVTTAAAPMQPAGNSVQQQIQRNQIHQGFSTFGQRSVGLTGSRSSLQEVDRQPQETIDLTKKFKRYGGLEVDKLHGLVHKRKRVLKGQLGTVDLYNVCMSLQSSLRLNETYALNVLTILSHDREILLKLADYAPLGNAIVKVLKTTVTSLKMCFSDEYIGFRTLLYHESAVATCLKPDAGSLETYTSSKLDERKVLMEKLLAVSTILRNLSVVTVENQPWLAKHPDYVKCLVDALRISPFEKFRDSKNNNFDDDSIFDEYGLDPDDISSLDTPLDEDLKLSDGFRRAEKLMFQDAATLVLEVRRTAFVALVNVSVQVKLASVSDAQLVSNIISDALQIHSDLLESCHHTPASLSLAWSTNPGSSAFLGDDLQPWMLLDGLSKLTIDIHNMDLFAECTDLERLLKLCLKVLPQTGGFSATGTQEELVCWELAMSCLYHLVVIIDGAPGNDARNGSDSSTPVTPRMPPMSKSKQCTFSKVPSLVPLLISLMRRPALPGMVNQSLNQQYDPLCIKASRIFMEALQRGGDEARRVVKKFESALVGLAITGPAPANTSGGISEEVWRRVGDILFLMNDEAEV
ncbi:hypothetical protein BCR33DRAFT_170564 [Rhizoclosmatium globosum]|uniref:SWI/SNF-like complex subunit BAF250 C-terminal domain-containing protein n=1 Tax=Rhizoclosmatium globosum TaxID=329046 RepID=A0A1Y2CEX8_9FUNG|nr:hypothetical protein BCR33DRAFT_170564 [Rhizoclosmatium globosum]|eukprot:ORY45582.1 hypothetical protein BCR33DRAFT_170564 [Rhizoclosmatium globosum]